MSEEEPQQKVFQGVDLVDEQPEIPTVSEAVLRKKKSIETYKQNKEARLIENQKLKEKKRKRKIDFKRAEHIVQNYRKLQRSEAKVTRLTSDGRKVKVDTNSRTVLLVRVTGKPGIDMDDKTQKILNHFRLTKVNMARLVVLNDFNKKMIRAVEPFIAYGYPTLKTVKDLVYKRGVILIDGKVTPITNNELIEEHLGKYNIICLEDIVHELFNVGEHFKEINTFLCPFKLTPPKIIEGTRKVTVSETPKTGNMKEDINQFVQAMN